MLIHKPQHEPGLETAVFPLHFAAVSRPVSRTILISVRNSPCWAFLTALQKHLLSAPSCTDSIPRPPEICTLNLAILPGPEFGLLEGHMADVR